MMRYLTLVYLLFIASCGRTPLDDLIVKKDDPPYDKNTTDETFRPYIDTLEMRTNTIVKTPIIFKDDMENTIAGRCTKWKRGTTTTYKEITINRKYWNAVSELSRQQLVDHEVGHCDFNRKHNDEMTQFDGNTCKASIMHSFAFRGSADEFCLENYIDEYIDELLQR